MEDQQESLSNTQSEGSSWRSLALIGAIVLATAIFHTGLRIWGYSTNYSERKSSILSIDPEPIWMPDLKPESYNLTVKNLKEACSDKSCVIAIPSYFTKDKQLYILEAEENKYQHLGRKEIRNSDELGNAPDANFLSLEGFIDTLPGAKGILFVNSNTPGIIDSLTHVLDKDKRYKRFIVCSDFGNVARTLRKKRPQYKTCATQDEEAKAHILSSIYLESIAELPSEYFYFSELDISRYSERLPAEINRRTYFNIVPADSAWKEFAKAHIYRDFAEFKAAQKASKEKQ